jgi:type IV secretion system protein TrbI
LIGVYDSQVAFGQSRVLLVWTRLIMPNGRSIMLERQPGADTAGYAGLEDEVDNHWGALFKAALLSTLLGSVANLARPRVPATTAISFRHFAADPAIH